MKRRLQRLGASDDADHPDARMSIQLYWDGERSSFDRLVVLSHGRNGCAHSPQMLKMVRPYVARGYLAVLPNCTGSAWNDSAGEERDFLIESHVRDTARAITWAENHGREFGWTGAGLALAGHSIGGYAVARLAATEWNGRADHLLLVSPFSSGKRQFEARLKQSPDALAALDRDVPRALAEWPTHDIFPLANRLTLPSAVVAGTLDPVAPEANVRELADALPGLAAFLLLPQASHCLEGGYYRQELADLLDRLTATSALRH